MARADRNRRRRRVARWSSVSPCSHSVSWSVGCSGASCEPLNRGALHATIKEAMALVIDVIRLLYGYSTWANTRIMTQVANLTPAQYIAPGNASHSSVRDTLVHLLWGQALWLSRWQERGDIPDEDPEAYTDLDVLRTRWDDIDAATQAFISRLDEAMLHAVVHYRIRGTAYALPLWQLMVHQVNHATQHRSEVATILTAYGHSPGSLDLVIYLQRPSV